MKIGTSPLESVVRMSSVKKIREALGLLNSMVLCGEEHSDVSRQVLSDAREAVSVLGDEIEHLRNLSLEHLQKKLGDWGKETFPEADEVSVLKHLQSEVAKELYEGCNIDELADVGILLCQLATHRKLSLLDLMVAKHQVNKKRKWGPKNEQGFWEHTE
jgi:hypothetical protein